MENPVIFITLLLIIGFYDDIEAIVLRGVKSLIGKKQFRSG